PVARARLRGSRPALVARADHRGLRRSGDRLPGEAQVLRLPDHPGARGDGPRRARAADRAGGRRRSRRDGDAVSALPPLARRVAVEAEGGYRPRLPDADPPPLAADRRRSRSARVRAEVPPARRERAAGAREARSVVSGRAAAQADGPDEADARDSADRLSRVHLVAVTWKPRGRQGSLDGANRGGVRRVRD